MRFIRKELSPANKPQYLIALGVKDLELLIGEAENAYNHYPPTQDDDGKNLRRRLNGIVRGLKEAYAVARHDGDEDGARVPIEKRQAWKNAQSENPMIDITRFEIIDHRPCKSCRGEGIILNNKTNGKGMICGDCQGMTCKGREVIVGGEAYKQPNDTVLTSMVQDKGRTLKIFLSERKEL